MVPDEAGLSGDEIAALKEAFGGLDCVVTDLEGESFEISHEQYRVATHVYATLYFLQFSTFIIARPKGFPFRTRSRLHAFLNRANTNSKLTRCYVEEDRPNAQFGGWMIMASARFVKGVIAGDWEREALDNCLKL